MFDVQKDYSLLGLSGKEAVTKGLVAADWYHSDVPRKTMRTLMRRRDGPAIRDTIIWFGAMIILAGVGIAMWPSLYSIPFWFAYGVMYGSGADSRWHECGHGTAFKTRWMNTVVYQIACFMMMRNPVSWQWSHVRHHTDTIIVGRDPEILIMRPPAAFRLFMNIFGLIDVPQALWRMVVNTSGRLDREEKTYIPAEQQAKVIGVARAWIAIYGIVIAVAIMMQSILPLMIIGLPRLYGAWHQIMTGLLQHGGLAENVLDHRQNSRTVLMNPISRFIYWNMNYHIEHHMFPAVPFHALPRLHETIKHDLPPPSQSIWSAFKELWPILKRQLRNENVFITPPLPTSAQPYRPELH